MKKLPDKVAIEMDNVRQVLGYLTDVCSCENKQVTELAAMETFLHNIYNGVENILKQIMKERELNIPPVIIGTKTCSFWSLKRVFYLTI